MRTNYLDELNEAQREAVLNISGPSLIIAGAGAGKTRTLTYRIAYLLEKGVKANRILALTFTNKAAGEMKERIAGIAGYETTRYLWMGTFHSIFARILRTEGEKLGYKPSYTIYDASDSRSLIKNIVKEMGIGDDIYKPGVISARISWAKNNLITALSYSLNPEFNEYDKSIRMPLLAEIYKNYATRCLKANAMDFDDLLLNTNILFRDFPELLEKYQNKFDYILVDEYQDTNYAQYLIIKKLSEQHRNICVVGDDAQSIYSFRGARIENILEFKDDYPEAKIFKLEQNYRSTRTIVNAANTIIANNVEQIHKTVFSKNEPGEKIRILQSMTDIEEGIMVASDIFDMRFTHRLNWSDFAILYRTNAQSRIFEETLRRKNIPYRIFGGLSFYERKEIKDILAYFRMVINPVDEEALKRTINYPRRGIGDTTIKKLLEIASITGDSAWNIIGRINDFSSYFNAATCQKLLSYREMIVSFAIKTEDMDAFQAAMEIAKTSGIIKDLQEGKTPEEVSRMENFEELINGIKEFTEAARKNGEPYSLGAYLQNVALLTDQDVEDRNGSDKVMLMTMHSAKGLEFSHVYITGMEDSIFPSPMSAGNPRDLEEERRLFYVAVTRAKKMATLTYALNRYKYGNLEYSKPSRFLREIDPAYIEFPQLAGRQYNNNNNNKTEEIHHQRFRERISDYSEVKTEERGKLLKVNIDSKSSFELDSKKPLFLTEGDKVIHDRFGTGRIISIDGEAPNTTALVDFEKTGRKKLLLRFANLRKA
ncbi:MAG TPA: UvrD-helicase domain-containing protein [Bacteroidales bacterium]|nr:UvrD-helicase domain-containing protein [Bacteroidales bacterium]HQG52521.1 UvrD-helicase domain-containing protein [Bacteroidales bacterium]HQJ20743.1 UvrD-helicase domain-containing protein [Bacteroidales bacterium]